MLQLGKSRILSQVIFCLKCGTNYWAFNYTFGFIFLLCSQELAHFNTTFLCIFHLKIYHFISSTISSPQLFFSWSLQHVPIGLPIRLHSFLDHIDSTGGIIKWKLAAPTAMHEPSSCCSFKIATPCYDLSREFYEIQFSEECTDTHVSGSKSLHSVFLPLKYYYCYQQQ